MVRDSASRWKLNFRMKGKKFDGGEAWNWNNREYNLLRYVNELRNSQTILSPAGSIETTTVYAQSTLTHYPLLELLRGLTVD